MVDLNAAYQDAKFLSDDDLKQELASPTGMIPGYIVMSELQDRQAIRAGAGSANPMSMKDEMLGGVRQYSRGGIIGQLNPFDTMAKAMRDPKLSAGIAQEAMNAAAGGLPALSAAQTPSAPSAPPSLSSLMPTASGAPAPLQKYAMGGLASLYRR